MTTRTLQVGPLTTRAALGSVNSEKRTVDVVWTTGAKVLRSSWFDGRFYEELSLDPKHVRMDRLRSGSAPFLANHDGNDVGAVLGVITSARLEKGRGVATVRFAPAGVDAEADKVFSKIEAGIIRNVSVGYRTYKLEKVEGGDAATPTFRATDWEPHEVSAVAIGADPDATFRSGVQTNEVVIVTAHNTRSNMENENEDLAQVERERVSGITAAVRTANLGSELAERLIKKGTSLSDARGIVLEQLAIRSEAIKTESHVVVDDEFDTRGLESSRVTMGRTAGEKRQSGAVSALLMRSAPTLVREAKAKNVPGFENIDAGPSEFRNLSLFDLAREALERKGVRTRLMSRMDLMGRALTMRSGPYGGVDDFPTLLENTMGKILLGAYAVQPDSWSRICKIESVDDFRPSPRYRTGSIGTLDTVAENGEFTNTPIPDGSKLSISTGTKGNIIAISRQALINDDMGAMADLAMKLGRAAKLSVEVDFFALLNANSGLGPTVGANPFFHSSNGNINATGSALTAAGIDADRVILGSQKDISGNEYLDLKPAVLLVPLSLGATARVLNASAINPDANGKIQQPNPAQGLFREIVESPRISGTRRYVFADTSVAPAFVVAMLNGQQEPYIETENGFRTDGASMKVRFDYLVQAFDVKGAVTNAGA